MFINFRLIIPISCREKNIINTPARTLKILELFKKNFPRIDAVDPKITKITEKPKAKKIVLITTRLFFSQRVFLKRRLKYKKYILELMEVHTEIKN